MAKKKVRSVAYITYKKPQQAKVLWSEPVVSQRERAMLLFGITIPKKKKKIKA